MSDDFLVVRIKHDAHLLEKATKSANRGAFGGERAARVAAMIEEHDRRGLGETAVMDWARGVLAKVDRWRAEGQQVVAVSSNGGEHQEDILHISSVRFWKPHEVEDSLVEQCVAAGFLAPGSCNRQPLKLGVLRNDPDRFEFGEALNASMFQKAPVRVFIFSNRENYSEKHAGAIDAGLFAEAFCIRAKQLGLATCCCYGSEYLVPSQEEARSMFGLADEYYCYLSILVGYADEDPVKPPRRSLERTIISRNV
jgi:nitroreductase